MQFKETTLFHCSRECLWSYIEEPDKQKQWMKGLISNESTNPGYKGVGSTFRMVIQEGRKQATYDGDVTVHDKPSRLEIRFWGGNFPRGMLMRVDYVLREEAGQTRLDYTCTAEGKVGFFMRVMFVLMKIFCRAQIRSFFRTLRTLVESPAPSPASDAA
jgi:carbon monoxide dehydrogenase subunit G